MTNKQPSDQNNPRYSDRPTPKEEIDKLYGKLNHLEDGGEWYAGDSHSTREEIDKLERRYLQEKEGDTW